MTAPGLGPYRRAYITNSSVPVTFASGASVNVGNFPTIQQVGDNGGSLTVDTGTAGQFSVSIIASAAAANGIVPIRTVNQSSLVLKASAGNFYSAYMLAGNTSTYFMALDRATVPATNSTLVATEILHVTPLIPSGQFGSLAPPDLPDRALNGCVLIATTSLTTFTPPSNPPFFLRGKMI